jgi:hypothetical protein
MVSYLMNLYSISNSNKFYLIDVSGFNAVVSKSAPTVHAKAVVAAPAVVKTVAPVAYAPAHYAAPAAYSAHVAPVNYATVAHHAPAPIAYAAPVGKF